MNCGFATHNEIKDFRLTSSQADSCRWCLAAGSAYWQDTHQMPKLYEYLGIVVLFYSNVPEGVVIDIVRVERVSDYKLRLSFSDGAERVIDFEPFLRRSRNPMIRAYLDPQKFANFTLEYGNLMWDDYGLCFPIADLYENNI